MPWPRVRLVVLCLALGVIGASAQPSREVIATTLTVGASPASPTDSSVRLADLATSGGSEVLIIDTATLGVRRRALAKGDLPASVGYKDETNTWSLLQTFTSGLTANAASSFTAGTFSSTLGVTGLATLTGGFSAGASSSVTGTLTATTLAATGAATVGTTLGVTGLSTLTGGYSAGASSSIVGNLTLTGTGGITAAGDIAVNGGDLTSTGALTVRPTGNLTLDPTGDIIVAGDGNDVLPNAGYTQTLGALSNKFLALHAAELWVETLVAQDTLATIGGRVLVAPTTLLTADLSAGATTIQVKHNNLANGDRVYMEANGKVEFFAVTSSAGGSAGAYTYSVTRNLDGSGANDWFAGDAVLNTGTTGNGFIDLYSVRGVKSGSEAGPTIVGNVRNSSTYNDWSPRWAVGNLNGLYSYASTEYGAAFGSPSGQHVTIEPTNGIRFRNSSTTWAQLSGSGLTLGTTAAGNGNLFADTSGNLFLRSGAVSRITMAASNGALSFLADDGTTAQVMISPSGVLVGETTTGRGNVLIDTAGNMFFRRATTSFAAMTGSGFFVGDPFTTNAPYLQATASALQFCVTGGSCTFSVAGTTGDITSTGSITLGTASHVKAGATGYGTGTGFWFGLDSGTPKFYIGNGTSGSSSYLTWNGTTLSVAGSLTATADIVLNGSANITKGSGSLEISNTGVAQPMTISAGGGGGTLTLNVGGITVGGNSAASATVTVRDAAGTGTCTFVFTYGMRTGGTC